MIGHSIGEYVAACLAGVFPLDDALALVAERGRLMQSLPAGAMLAVPLTEDEGGAAAGRRSSRSPRSTRRTAAWSPARTRRSRRCARELAAARGRRAAAAHLARLPLGDDGADPGALRRALSPASQLQPPRIPYISNVTGTWITDAEATDPAYWARHLRQAVRFADGVARALPRRRSGVLLEVGPGQTLATLARQHPDCGTRARRASPRSATRRSGKEDLPVLLKTLGQLWLAGVEPDWSGFYARERRRRVPLPTYPFERRRYWVEREDGPACPGRPSRRAARSRTSPTGSISPYWKPSLPPAPSAAAVERAGRWLVFLDERGARASRLVARLTRRGAAGDGRAGRRAASARPARGATRSPPARREDYDALIKDLAGAGGLPDCVAPPLERRTGHGPTRDVLRAGAGAQLLEPALPRPGARPERRHADDPPRRGLQPHAAGRAARSGWCPSGRCCWARSRP